MRVHAKSVDLELLKNVEEELSVLIIWPHMPSIRYSGKLRSKLTLLMPPRKHQKRERYKSSQVNISEGRETHLYQFSGLEGRLLTLLFLQTCHVLLLSQTQWQLFTQLLSTYICPRQHLPATVYKSH